MQAKVYNTKGKESGTVELADAYFGLPWNADLVHQVVTSMMTNARKPIAHAKTRAEVSGGGRKPWQQKGTGRARHGSIRSPIWIGGGAAHGPTKDRNYARKINKKMKAKALFTILSAKLRDGELVFIDSLVLPSPKTKEAQTILNNLATVGGFVKINYKIGKRAYITLPEASRDITKSFNNIKSTVITTVEGLNPVEVMKYKYVVLANPTLTIPALTKKLGK